MDPRRNPGFPWGARPAWAAAIPAVRALKRWWGGLEILGGGMPDGPVVVAANHLSHVDPVVVSLAADRPMRYLALDELYGNNRFFDALTLWLGAIPVPRAGVPLGAMRTSLAELRAGGTVGVFPEGARVKAWGERPVKRGAAWLARRAGVPLVPVAVAGTDGVMPLEELRLHRAPVVAAVAEPIDPADHDGAGDPIASMMTEWSTRIDQALREGYERLRGST